MIFLHHYAIKKIMVANSSEKWASKYFSLSDQDKIVFSSYIHSTIHAWISSLGAIYGFIYADGQPGTCYFYNEHYQNNLFDVSRYFMAMIVGYFIYDVIFCTLCFKKDALMLQTYLHHFIGITCFVQCTWLNDKIG